jgi:hypothetical protein
VSPETTASTAAKVGETPAGFTPLSVEEAQALMSEALTGLDRDTLLAERAEAEAQVRAAQATLGVDPTSSNGDGAPEQEPDEAAQNTLDVDAPIGASTLDIAELRRAAAAARIADDTLARAASEAAGRPPAGEAQLGVAESAFARVLEIQEDLPAAWRRLVGALISATGMAIVVGALGWSTYWLLVPIALIAILTVDLRLSGRAAREASAEAAQELASVGLEGVRALDLIRGERAHTEESESRLAAARAQRDAAYAAFEELAPGRLPSEVDEIIAEYEAEQAEQAAQAEAEAAARAEAEAEAAVEVEVEPDAAPEVTLPEPEVTLAEPTVTAAEPPAEETATASQWWFGSTEAPAPPAAASAPVRALAERLSAEGREALKRIEAQLAALERVELAKKSLEWHEANGSASPTEGSEKER